MKIVFFGTPEFAVPSAEKILKSEHELAAVVTVPDKEQGRGRKPMPSAIKKFALQHNIPVLQPEKLKDEIFHKDLAALNADLFVVVAFKILPPAVFEMPPKGSFNLHGSLLPKYRGAAPMQWAIIKGENKTGLTTFKLEKKVDTGNIYLQREVPIYDDDVLGDLHDRMSLAGSELVLETVELIDSGSFELQSQDDSLATPAPKITKEMCEIDWSKPAADIHNLVRGLSPIPGAFFIHNDTMYKVFRSALSSKELPPGKIFESGKELTIGCGTGSLTILEIQPEGRKRMQVDAFLRGYSLTKE